MKSSLQIGWINLAAACAVGLFIMMACSSSMMMRSELEQTTQAYADALRWRKVEGLSLFASGPLREEFKSRLNAFGDVVVTDYRVVSVDFDESNSQAVVEAEIAYYKTNSYRVKTLRDHQVWSYVETNGRKQWQLKTLLPLFP
ncbi:MAG: hypothetical protein ACWGN7_03465 [Thermodesulfovibrionales bacterium]